MININAAVAAFTLLQFQLLILQGRFLLHEEPIPMRTSMLTGQAWVEELLASPNPARIHEQARMPKKTFLKLCTLMRERRFLKDTDDCSTELQVLLFLFIVGQNASNRTAGERFQLSGETVSRYFHRVLNAVTSLSRENICQPQAGQELSAKIQDNPKFFPYFRDALGALDGTHIPMTIPNDVNPNAFRNRKGFHSQNVLAVCSFEMRFLYVLPGWEGSANDGLVLRKALEDDLIVPQGKYYLGDGGYTSRDSVLVPYRGVRYHLKEFRQGVDGPQTKEELFNLRHATLRNAIERIFGIMKKRFPILTLATLYGIRTQVSLVTALCTLHNFISKHSEEGDGDNIYDIEYDREEQLAPARHNVEPPLNADVGDAERLRAKEKRDNIAEQMWNDYKRIMRQRGRIV